MLTVKQAVGQINQLNRINQSVTAIVNFNEETLTFLKRQLEQSSTTFLALMNEIDITAEGKYTTREALTVLSTQMSTLSSIIAQYEWNDDGRIHVEARSFIKVLESFSVRQVVLFSHVDFDFYYENEWNKDSERLDLGHVLIGGTYYAIQIVEDDFEFATEETIRDYNSQFDVLDDDTAF